MRLTIIFFSITLTCAALAQAPQAFDFQGVARDATGNIIPDQAVALRISILSGSETGPVVYRETHALSTSPYGLFSIAVGQGTPVEGNFATVAWATAAHYMRVEMDATGGSTYQDLGTTRLLSVPYALHAATSGSGGGGSLDAAYDFGGAGQGRTITTDAGAVQVVNAGSNTVGLQVSSAVPNSSAVRADHGGLGVALRAESTSPANTFATVQATTNSSDANNSAILGNNDGAGYAVAGQIPATATGTAAVHGSNLRSTGGSGMSGIGFNGVVGQAQNAAGYGLYGSNGNAADGVTTLGVGTYGLGLIGIYGQTTDISTGWAGYFTADLGVEGTGYALGGWQTASDRRLKRDIRPIVGALDLARRLEGHHYTLLTRTRNEAGDVVETTREQYGVIAQDVEAVLPALVSERALYRRLGDETIYKTVDYNQLVPVLLEAVKELSLQVEQLQERIRVLER